MAESDWIDDHHEDDWVDDETKPGELESFGRGAAQGGSLGFADEITGGLESLLTDKTYEQARDESRRNYKLAEETNPVSYGAGQVGGGLATLAIPGAGEATLGRLALRGATEGAAYGLGASEAPDAEHLTYDTAKGFGIGALGGAAAKGVMSGAEAAAPYIQRGLKYAGDKVGSFAEKAAVNATGATGKQAANFSDDAGRELLDRGIVSFGNSQEQIAAKASKAVQGANAEIDNALKTLDAQGVQVDSDAIVNVVKAKIAELKQDPSQGDVVRLLERELENVADSIGARGSSSQTLSAAEKTKRGYNRKAGNWADPEKGMAGKEMYQTYRDAVEASAEAADPATAALFREGKESYGLLRPIEEAAERRAATTAQSPVGGFLDTAAGAAGAVAAGGPGAVVAPIARRIISPRISSSVAVGADKISNLLHANPMAFGKYGKVLTDASRRGATALSANHFVLQQTDPEYRELIKRMVGSEDNE